MSLIVQIFYLCDLIGQKYVLKQHMSSVLLTIFVRTQNFNIYYLKRVKMQRPGLLVCKPGRIGHPLTESRRRAGEALLLRNNDKNRAKCTDSYFSSVRGCDTIIIARAANGPPISEANRPPEKWYKLRF